MQESGQNTVFKNIPLCWGLWDFLLTHSHPKLQQRSNVGKFLGFTFIVHNIPWPMAFRHWNDYGSLQTPRWQHCNTWCVPVPSWKLRDCKTLDDEFGLVNMIVLMLFLININLSLLFLFPCLGHQPWYRHWPRPGPNSVAMHTSSTTEMCWLFRSKAWCIVFFSS